MMANTDYYSLFKESVTQDEFDYEDNYITEGVRKETKLIFKKLQLDMDILKQQFNEALKKKNLSEINKVKQKMIKTLETARQAIAEVPENATMNIVGKLWPVAAFGGLPGILASAAMMLYSNEEATKMKKEIKNIEGVGSMRKMKYLRLIDTMIRDAKKLDKDTIAERTYDSMVEDFAEADKLFESVHCEDAFDGMFDDLLD